ncbi:MAG: SLBB domain-containing protein [Prochlorococcaceae cyanobacterium]
MQQPRSPRLLRVCVASVAGASALVPYLNLPVRAQALEPITLEIREGVPQGSPEPGPSAAPAPVPQDDAYILGPGDGLQLRFLSLSTRQDLSGAIEVISDGTATVPLIGSVRLSGLTLSQASLWLQTLYGQQLLRPELDLLLVRPRPLRVSLVGEVERPGIYTLSTQEVSQTLAQVPITGLPTLVDAIQKAGGVTGDADLRQVLLRRRLPGEEVRYRRARVDLLTLIQQGDQIQNPILFDGDIIQLPKAAEPVVELSELAVTTIAPPEITVNVVGEVVRPGPVQVKPNTPLVQAVLAAGGGVVQRAKTNRVDLIRINRNGTLTRMAVPLNLGAPPSPEFNPPMRDGDVVVVNRSNYARLTDAINAVGGPLTTVVSALTLLQIVDDN